MSDSLQYFCFLNSLTYSATIPDTAITHKHAANTVVVFSIWNFVNFNVDVHFVIREILTQHIFHFSHKLFALVWQFIIFYVVRDCHNFRRAEFSELNGFYVISCFYFEYYIPIALRVISFLNIGNCQLYAHLSHKRNQP